MLVGREREAAALAAALDRPGLVVVAGPAGIGKTALVRTAVGRAVLAAGALATLRYLPGLPLTRALRGHGVTRRPTTGAGTLSPRERESLALVGQGLSTRRIAELLGITRHTAETYVKAGMGKLGARTRTEAAVLAAALPVAAGA